MSSSEGAFSGKTVPGKIFQKGFSRKDFPGRLSMNVFTDIGETGYGCHTFYITDVFRNMVIIADIRLLLCLNIVYCAHINMQFVIFTS